MNQIIKHEIYGLGNKQQVELMIQLGGMNAEEVELLRMLHDQKPDTYIQDVMHLDVKAYRDIEASVMTKTRLAVFDCINSKINSMY